MKKIIIVGFSIMFLFVKNSAMSNYEKVFHDFQIESINGEIINFKEYENKVILLVNTASYCGFTKQYKGLQELTNKFSSEDLSIIAIPSNDFGRQEPGNNKEIKDFCEGTYGITFPIMSKQKVIGKNKHAFYKWIESNHGNKKLPRWNFHKYVINRDGELLYSISSRIAPSSSKFLAMIADSLK